MIEECFILTSTPSPAKSLSPKSSTGTQPTPSLTCFVGSSTLSSNPTACPSPITTSAEKRPSSTSSTAKTTAPMLSNTAPLFSTKLPTRKSPIRRWWTPSWRMRASLRVRSTFKFQRYYRWAGWRRQEKIQAKLRSNRGTSRIGSSNSSSFWIKGWARWESTARTMRRSDNKLVSNLIPKSKWCPMNEILLTFSIPL